MRRREFIALLSGAAAAWPLAARAQQGDGVRRRSSIDARGERRMYLLKIGPVAALVLSGVASFLLALAPLGWRIGLWQYGFGLYWMMPSGHR